MRVVGGALAGRLLQSPRGTATRPTLDRVREALFNVLARRVPGAVVLDLYAGTGALAIEALSRGARRADLVDRDRRASSVVRRNLANLGLADRATVWTLPAERAVERFAAAAFDLVFLDPPWADGVAPPVRQSLHRLLQPDGLAVVEYEAPASAGDWEQGGLVVMDQRRYGRTHLVFLAPTTS
ncbi:MAG: 16S rRNA (guanine(966)-N(2))-methyltransferase RsmD [Thermaerobacter sp.]|nr:16S rRNA (guanine(966)-N(2))-methyltransferase RsmD [Thermaerobacter sp.]